MKKLIKWFLNYFEERNRKRRFKKRIEEIRKRDPFTYNH